MYPCSRAAASRSRERNRESILARLRTCMRRMLAWCTGPLYVHSDVLSPSRECSRVPRYIASCSAPRHLASLTYDTIRTSHKAGR
ncbi:hypothetical protein ALC57_07066 [Trachymyrmex cornetzi]|uniref:Uncharacterized protein n=1 Tax=Trachymyrmex cornetzi TaxID=471704 RepID=A0A195E6S8_9HYME|nr:hypothetical protein ALC57_07066 [Trachymyrmex cornetzi]